MKVLVVSQYYPPEAVPIPADVARELANRGHSVRVLTGFPNYPAGRVFSGYRQRWRTREEDGPVGMLRVPLYADHSQNPSRRVANYLSFGLSSAMAWRYARGADVVYVYATQMTAALGPWLWRLGGGAPYVLHIQDLWPDSVLGSSMVDRRPAIRWIVGVLSRWLRSVYARAAHVIGIAPTMVTTLTDRGVPTRNASVVYNWADGPDRPIPPARRRADATTRIVYAGNVGEMQDLQTSIRAAHAAADAGVTLTIVGDGVARDRLRSLVDELGCTNVIFEEPVPREAMADVYAMADYGLVVLKDLPVFRGTVPSKFQSVLAHGLPVVTTVQGDVRRLVEGLGVGLTADAEDVASLEAAFRQAADLDPAEHAALRDRARETFDEHFDRDTAVAAIEKILQQASTHSGRR